MKLGQIAEIIKGIYFLEKSTQEKVKVYRVLSMLFLEPISFLAETNNLMERL